MCVAHDSASDPAGLKIHCGLGGAPLVEVAAVLTDAFADYPVEISFTPDSLSARCAADDVVSDACGLAFDRSGRLLGVCLAALRGDCGRVAAMGVAREAHRRGIGRALVETVLQTLHRAGARRVILEALTVNAPALALYETQLGFRRRRRLIGFTRPPGGEPVRQSQWERVLLDHSEPDSWQLARAIAAARRKADLVSVAPVIPEHHPVAALLREAGFAQAAIDQYELERSLPATGTGPVTHRRS